MNKAKFFSSLMIITVSCLGLTLTAQDFDYRSEESPAISWNGVPLYDARLLALAGISSMASKPFAGTINPAMGAETEKINCGISVNALDYESVQFWGINQGVIQEPAGISDQKIVISGLAITVPFRNLYVSAGWFINNLLEFPAFNYIQEYDQDSWVYSGEFQGKENNIFLTLARKFGKKFNLGIKFDYVFGKRDLEINDTYHFIYMSNPEFNRIQHRENHDLTYLTLSVGATWKLSPGWSINSVLIYPLNGNVQRLTVREFYSSLTETQIIISSQEYENKLFRPKKIYIGTTYDFSLDKNLMSRRFTVAAEMVYSLWSEYRYEYFGESLPRNMRNTMVFAGAIEYADHKKSRDIFLRAGYRFDPQPLMEARANIHTLSGGAGIRLGKFSWDLGLSYYFCTVDGVSQNHLVFVSTFAVIFPGGK